MKMFILSEVFMSDKLVYSTQTSNDAQLNKNLFIRIAAEFFGTALVAFTIYVLSSLMIIFPYYTVTIGLPVAGAIFVVGKLFGGVSGAHINPAVTFAAMLTGYTKVVEGISYIFAQVLGAFAAAGLWLLTIPNISTTAQSQGVTKSKWMGFVVNGYDANSPLASMFNSESGTSSLSYGISQTLVIEIVFTLAIVAVFMATMNVNGTMKNHHNLAYATVYGVAITVGYMIDGGGFNPARSTGIAIVGALNSMKTNPLSQLWVFWVAPLVAAAVVAFIIIMRDSISSYVVQKEQEVFEQTLEVTDDIDDTDEFDSDSLETPFVVETQLDQEDDSASVGPEKEPSAK